MENNIKKLFIGTTLCIGLIMPSINYASQPSNQNWFFTNASNAYNWAAAKLAGFKSAIPSVNFGQWATNLANRLTLAQRYTLTRILGTDQPEKPIEKNTPQ